MAHFYGLLSGNRGEATRAGSKDSGYRAWAQNMTGRVLVNLWHNSREDRDMAEITIDSSTMNYGGSTALRLGAFDLDALVNSASWDAATKRHLNAARSALDKANEAAIKAEAKRQKLMEKTYGKAS